MQIVVIIVNRELFLANIIKYCQLKGESVAKACENAQIGKNYVSNIKRGQWPSIASVYNLAQHLGCTVSDLVGDNLSKEESNNVISEQFQALYAALSPEQRLIIEKAIKKEQP